MIFSWHQTTWDKFTSARSNDHLPHAILLSGSDGVGKLEFANSMVKSLLCISPENNQACDKCQGCKTYESGANPDYLHIELQEGKQQISVDQIRELSKFLNYTRSFDAYRVVLLNPTERMNLNAANSLLKSLEEPAANTIIILLATQLSRILPTIKSRCQLLHIPIPKKEQAVEWLQTHVPEIENPEKALQLANGMPLHAADLDEEIGKNKEAFEADLLEIMLENKSVTEIAKQWEKFDRLTLIDWQLIWIQSFIKNTPDLTAIQQKIREKITTSHQWILYQALINQKQLVHTSVNPLIFVENMLLLWLKASQCHTQK